MLPARLVAFTDTIRGLDPDAPTIPYRIERWNDHLGDNKYLSRLSRRFQHRVSRGDLGLLSREAHADPEGLPALFLATMIWGFGDTNYGPWRTRRMLDDLARQKATGTDALGLTLHRLRDGDLMAAYRGFDVEWCGPPFVAKFFYAVGLGMDVYPMPLILDSVVATSLWVLALDRALDIRQYVKGVDASGKGSVTRYPEGYVRYVRLLHEWGQALGCRADAVEMFLFDPPAAFSTGR